MMTLAASDHAAGRCHRLYAPRFNEHLETIGNSSVDRSRLCELGKCIGLGATRIDEAIAQEVLQVVTGNAIHQRRRRRREEQTARESLSRDECALTDLSGLETKTIPA
jgi:hypothetical protein